MNPRFFIVYSRQATRFLERMEKREALRFLSKIEEVSVDPFRCLEHYEGEGYKLRVVSLRALVSVDAERKVLSVRNLDKRGRIYK